VNKSIALAAVLLVTMTTLPALPSLAIEPLAFNGLLIGEKTTSATIMRQNDVKCAPVSSVAQVCNGYTTLFGRGSNAEILIENGILVRVSIGFPPAHFRNIIAAVAAKFGPPHETIEDTVNNRMGGQFKNVIFVWRDASQNMLRISHFGATIDQGSYLLINADNIGRFGKSGE
jgi:hypothetical protein